jgi:hypothetical protein
MGYYVIRKGFGILVAVMNWVFILHWEKILIPVLPVLSYLHIMVRLSYGNLGNYRSPQIRTLYSSLDFVPGFGKLFIITCGEICGPPNFKLPGSQGFPEED